MKFRFFLFLGGGGRESTGFEVQVFFAALSRPPPGKFSRPVLQQPKLKLYKEPVLSLESTDIFWGEAEKVQVFEVQAFSGGRECRGFEVKFAFWGEREGVETDKVQVFELPIFWKSSGGVQKVYFKESVRKPVMVQVNSKVHVLWVGGVGG